MDFLCFCSDIHISLSLCLICLSPDLSLSFQAIMTWPDFETLNLSCNDIGMSTAQHCLEWSRKYVVQSKHEFVKPARSFAAKQDVLQNYIHTRIYLSTYFCPGLYE